MKTQSETYEYAVKIEEFVNWVDEGTVSYLEAKA